MKKVNSMSLIGTILICGIVEAKNEIQNDQEMLRKIENRSWGKLNYTTFSHLDIVFDQFDLQHTKACYVGGGLRIPMGVTHVNLELSGTYEFIEFPETIKYVKKDIFKECKVKTILLSNKTVEQLFKNGYEESTEESLYRYFSLNDSTEIIVGSIIEPQNSIQNNVPRSPLLIKNKEKQNNFLNEVHNFNKGNLKHVEEEKVKKNNNENGFTNELLNFDKNKLKHVERNKKVNQVPENPLFNEIHKFNKDNLKHVEEEKVFEGAENPFLNEIHNFDKTKLKHRQESKDIKKQAEPMIDSLRKVMEKRRADIAPEEEDDSEEEQDWDD